MNSRSMSGWIGFAAILLVIVGLIDFFQGLIAVFEDEYYVPTGSGFLVLDLTGWGWTMMIWERCSFSAASRWEPGRVGHAGSRSWSSA